MHVKSGDTVVIISGKDRGKTGKVYRAMPKESRVVVEGVNMVTKHKKAAGPKSPGGILKFEAPLNISKVMLYCPKDKAGVRFGIQIKKDGTKVRVCKKCGEEFDK